ncbi:uncharacterized protein LOC128199204 [Bicyclus anynana]|uniref:Uncharacterized protein LOC128199204 n=1 Tax=Bicyclus anynana TaxID=110368 RepID=A0ABM3LX22_BICAN|nr:uncharacterized protein LOC128199204 [Bicyclus anynana]
MLNLSENYYLRKHYLENEQVPTQTVMKERMTPALANVYFKSMTPKLKVLAGLEPPLKGGGSDWFIPPEDLLKGRAVMKPIKHEYLSKLGFISIDRFGDKLVQDHHKAMEEEKRRVLQESDAQWKLTVEASCSKQWDETSRDQAKQNTAKIQQAFHEFSMIYTTSITSIETLLFDAAIKEIQRVEEETFIKMSNQYAELLKQQATMLYDRFAIKMSKEKARQKKQFINTVENARTEMSTKIHVINVEKRVAVEKLRMLLEYQNLACQVYVALKEREECKKHMEHSKHEHKKIVKVLTKQIKMQDFEIRLEKEKEVKREDFIKVWQKKICHVVKKFQLFVKYCLNSLPEYADFFLNMEKLMLLQLSEAMDNPRSESIFVPQESTFHAPVPKPHPFFLFCDKGYKPKIDQDLCPEHCTSSASLLPVIVVNKRCLYAACDNLETFTEKVKQFLDGHRGDDDDLVDDHDYKFDIPVKCTLSNQAQELKLESSLMQVLQNELAIMENMRICCLCSMSVCNCKYEYELEKEPTTSLKALKNDTKKAKKVIKDLTIANDYGEEITEREVELEHEREPKLESYLDYIIPKRCRCPKRAKKHLEEHLPVYMRNMSPFEEIDLPYYKTCPVDRLKTLVKTAQRRQTPLPPPKIETKTRDKSTQYSEQECDFLCTCFSDEEVDKIFQNVLKDSKLFDQGSESKFTVVDASLSPTHLQKNVSSFVLDRARSLRRLMGDTTDLGEIFKKQKCDF